GKHVRKRGPVLCVHRAAVACLHLADRHIVLKINVSRHSRSPAHCDIRATIPHRRKHGHTTARSSTTGWPRTYRVAVNQDTGGAPPSLRRRATYSVSASLIAGSSGGGWNEARVLRATEFARSVAVFAPSASQAP